MYINDSGHVWKVRLGVPYATNYWQVGDSSKQKRTFKTLWYQKKRELVCFRGGHGPTTGEPRLHGTVTPGKIV
jgi:hypothetical protein